MANQEKPTSGRPDDSGINETAERDTDDAQRSDGTEASGRERDKSDGTATGDTFEAEGYDEVEVDELVKLIDDYSNNYLIEESPDVEKRNS